MISFDISVAMSANWITHWKDKLWQQTEVEENENLKLHRAFISGKLWLCFYVHFFDSLIGVGPGIFS